MIKVAMDDEVPWRFYTIQAKCEGKVLAEQMFYAPSESTAFLLARSRFPGATSWECLGSSLFDGVSE